MLKKVHFLGFATCLVHFYIFGALGRIKLVQEGVYHSGRYTTFKGTLIFQYTTCILNRCITVSAYL